jgi:hypothetical protein
MLLFRRCGDLRCYGGNPVLVDFLRCAQDPRSRFNLFNLSWHNLSSSVKVLQEEPEPVINREIKQEKP